MHYLLFVDGTRGEGLQLFPLPSWHDLGINGLVEADEVLEIGGLCYSCEQRMKNF